MAVYLNYYANIEHSVGEKVAVSNTIPSWSRTDIDLHLKYIAPKWDIVNMYKEGKVAFDKFIELYKTQLILDGSIGTLIRDIKHFENCTLLCYEVKGCHRELLGKALREIGFDVFNIKKGGEIIEISGGLL